METTPFTKETLVKGQPTRITCLEVDGQTYTLMRTSGVRVARLEDEHFDNVRDPYAVVTALRAHADIFTFWQRIPNTEPRFPYHVEFDTVAVLPLTTYEAWWSTLNPKARNMIRKGTKKGVVVRESAFDEAFVRGVTDLFNETPVRQGRRFWHYGKDEATVRVQFSRFLFRETMLGAYVPERVFGRDVGDKLLGFIMLADAGGYSVLGQILSRMDARELSPTNALLAKAVELTTKRGHAYLQYAYWDEGASLTAFKRQNGFQPMRLPRYYVPLTAAGRLAMTLGLHHGVKAMIPPSVKERLKRVRTRWLAR
jgi:hypothetical protein